jgi:hypothetical protein
MRYVEAPVLPPGDFASPPSVESVGANPCTQCGIRPRWFDTNRGVLSPWCGNTCRTAAGSGNSGGRPATATVRPGPSTTHTTGVSVATSPPSAAAADLLAAEKRQRVLKAAEGCAAAADAAASLAPASLHEVTGPPAPLPSAPCVSLVIFESSFIKSIFHICSTRVNDQSVPALRMRLIWLLFC